MNFPRLVFVIAAGLEPNAATNHELILTNYLMTQFPGHIFLARSTFIMTELFHPRDNMEWANVYRNLVHVADAVYGAGPEEDVSVHPLISFAYDIACPVLTNEWDLALFFASADAE